ncbi:DoxX-like family protein [Cohnella terricola]|uniref:DoxX-like family protein n=1 Tax=Cohnella terricola TaxID=1289167 RepID=A0A559JCT3_9BACL|nr:DoxX-like family protein [Cohnella terricola]TVX97689.1 hypothetical protein FPZ45_18130 [Cohnella terricola]
MKSKPIYVEIDVDADMETLWKHTQEPELHRQWDLRFSDITYLPKPDDEERQAFLYRTRIGFGLDIAGTGETKATIDVGIGSRLSTLSFGSKQRISLIRKGGGYWKYEPGETGKGIVFKTRYDYDTRFGIGGKWLDRLLFRPLFGYATAWSFDRLRLWLEKGIYPAVSAEKAIVHYSSLLLLAFLWLYQGIVPKLLYPESGELALLRQTGWFSGLEEIVLPLVGIGEIGLAFVLVANHRKKWAYKLQAVALLALGVAALTGMPNMLKDPFNPLTLGLAMAGLGAAAARTADELPNAARCRRKPVGQSNDVKRGKGKS